MEQVRPRALRALLMLASATVMLSGCGGGGGGATPPTVPPSDGPVLAADAGVYFPGAGLTKHFRGSDTRGVAAAGAAHGYDDTETWTASDSQRSTVETNPLDNGTNGLSSVVRGSWSIGADGVHDLSGALDAADVLTLRSPVRQGDAWTAVDRQISVPDFDRDGKADNLKVVVSVRVAGNESVQVPGGTFASVLKVITTSTLTATGTSAGALAPEIQVRTDWYSSRVGRVKTVLVDGTTTEGGVGNSVTEELAGYRDPTRAFGWMAPEDLFADRTLDYIKAPAAISGNGSTFLIGLAQGAWVANQSLQGGGPVIATLVAEDGRPGPTLTLFDQAIDGGLPPALVDTPTGYLAVAADGTGLLVQRVDASSNLLDGRTGSRILSTQDTVAAPAMARLGDRILLAWNESAPGDGVLHVRAMLLDAATGQPASAAVTLASSGYSGYPRVAASVDGYLVGFSSYTTAGNYWLARAWPATLMASRIDAAGQPVDAQPFALSEPGSAHGVADVQYDGHDFVVTWADNRNHPDAPLGSVSPPEDSYAGSYLQDVFMTKVSFASGAAAAGWPATGAAISGTLAYRDSPALVFGMDQVLAADDLLGASMENGIYFRWLPSTLAPTDALAVPDNVLALDTLPSTSVTFGQYSLVQAAGGSNGALVTFFGGASGKPGALHASLVLPPTTE